MDFGVIVGYWFGVNSGVWGVFWWKLWNWYNFGGGGEGLVEGVLFFGWE